MAKQVIPGPWWFDNPSFMPAEFIDQMSYDQWQKAYEKGEAPGAPPTDDETGFTDDEALAFLRGTPELALTADAEPRTGAMIALVPDAETAQRLVLPGGEPLGELHLTLCYLGEAAKIVPMQRSQLLEAMRRVVDVTPIVDAEAFGVATWNPHNNEMNTALVYNVGGGELDDVFEDVLSQVSRILEDDLPEQYDPWSPHVCAAYSSDTGLLHAMSQKLGHVRFDRLRVAFAGVVTDFPLYDGTINDTVNYLAASGFREDLHPRDREGQFSPKGGVLGKLKKAIPAIIYKKHAHNTVVAKSASGDTRLRWDESSKKFIRESRDGEDWKHEQSLGKGQAYEDLKTGQWVSATENTSHAPSAPKKTPTKVTSPTPDATPDSPSPSIPAPIPSPVPSEPQHTDEIQTIRAKLASIQDEARKWEEMEAVVTHKAGIGKVLNAQDHADSKLARTKLKELREQATPLVDRELDLLIADNGEPWGSIDTEEDAKRWASAGGASTINTATFDGKKFQKQRDQYVANDKMTIANNRSLRSDDPSPAAKSWRGRMNRIIQMQTLASDTHVYRGAVLSPETIMKLKPGSALVDKGTMSTDVDLSGADFYMKTRYDDRPGTIMTRFKIRAPKGRNVADVDYGEFVFAPETPLRVVSLSRDSDGVVEVLAEIVE